MKATRIALIVVLALVVMAGLLPWLRYFTISAKKLPRPNPASYVFHVGADDLQRTLWRTHCYWCGNSASHCPNDEGLTMNSPTKLVMSPPYWQKSAVFFSFGTPLDYTADYIVDITPLNDSTTAVRVQTSNAAVRVGTAFGGVHTGDLRHPVTPTTVEEYKFLLTLGCELREPAMPALQLPK